MCVCKKNGGKHFSQSDFRGSRHSELALLLAFESPVDAEAMELRRLGMRFSPRSGESGLCGEDLGFVKNEFRRSWAYSNPISARLM